METTDGNSFICNNSHKIKHAVNQSSDYSRSGRFCAKIDQENPFGLVHTIRGLKKGNQIIISVWEKADQNKGYLKICQNNGTILHVKRRSINKSSNEWELITFSYTVNNYSELQFYIHNDSEKPAYYDDLKIEIFDKVRKVDLGDENIKIIIAPEDYDLLAKNREIALKNGVIDKSLKKYIRGKLIHKKIEVPIKLRFKGDWPDHLETDKWSFRIKVTGDHSFKGLKSFSIQSPHTRTFLKEWIMHQIFKDEGVLTTRYDFISVDLNGKSLGIYAYEEHFDKQLLEFNQRREAPILKFNEEGLWESRINNQKKNIIYPYYEASEVIPFKKNRTLNSEILSTNLINANELMLMYKEFHSDLSDVFDLEKAAKFYALCDLGKIRHSFHWHNQRFYFNPLTIELEHIAFDCYAGIDEGIKDVIYGYSEKEITLTNNGYLSKQIFNNELFNKLYKKYLAIYTSEEFLNTISTKYLNKSDSLTKLIRQEFPAYQFNLKYLYDQANDIKKLLPDFNKKININIKKLNYDKSDIGNNYFPSIGIKAIKSKIIDDSVKILIDNFHLDKVLLVGYGSSKNMDSIFYLKKPIMIDEYNSKQKSLNIKTPISTNYLFFIPQNLNTLHKVKIKKWPYHSKNLQ